MGKPSRRPLAAGDSASYNINTSKEFLSPSVEKLQEIKLAGPRSTTTRIARATLALTLLALPHCGSWDSALSGGPEFTGGAGKETTGLPKPPNYIIINDSRRVKATLLSDSAKGKGAEGKLFIQIQPDTLSTMRTDRGRLRLVTDPSLVKVYVSVLPLREVVDAVDGVERGEAVTLPEAPVGQLGLKEDGSWAATVTLTPLQTATLEGSLLVVYATPKGAPETQFYNVASIDSEATQRRDSPAAALLYHELEANAQRPLNELFSMTDP